MNAIKEHISATSEVFKVLFRGKYLIFFVPGAIITLLYLYSKYVFGQVADSANIEEGSWYINWLYTAINWLSDSIFGFFSFIFDQLYIWIILTALSPFNTLLAERFDRSYTGDNFEGGFERFIKDIFRMIFVVIISLFLEFAILLLYWMVSWILPDLINSIVYHLIAAFFFGFAMYDFHLERYQEGVFSSLGFAFSNMLTMLLTGSIFILIYNIPYVGIPLAPVITVMISTLVYLSREKKLSPDYKRIQENNYESIV